MKKKIFATLVVLALIACGQNNKPSDTTATAANKAVQNETAAPKNADEKKADEPVVMSNDLRTFGLYGNVKETLTLGYEAEEKDGKLVKGKEKEDLVVTTSFDEKGRVCSDPYGGIYTYDADGKFVKGVSEKTEMKRDAQGRLTYYDQREDDEDDAMFHNEYTYDDKGRIAKLQRQGWEVSIDETFSYEGNNLYPSSHTLICQDEGTDIEMEEQYKYTKFDPQGNWTEREVTLKQTESEEGSNMPPKTTNEKSIEVRTIKYY